MFRHYYHFRTPRNRSVEWDGLDHTQGDISLEITVDPLLPVAGDGDWSVDSCWLDSGLHRDGKRLTFHHGQFLPGALVEGGGGVVIDGWSCS